MVMATNPATVNCNPMDRHERLLSSLNSCKEMTHLKQIHAQTIRSTSPNHRKTVFLYSRILHFASLHDINYAYRVFDNVDDPNTFMWNTLIKACAHSNDCKEQVFGLYKKMLEEGMVSADKYTFPFIFKACAYLFSLMEGKQAHAQMLKSGLESDVYVINSLIHFYASCGCLESARNLFDKMPERSVVSWNAMIDALVQFGEFESALDMFVMLQEVFEPDGYTMHSVLNACAGLGALSLGIWAHAFWLRKFGAELGKDVVVNNCLVDMYCKCGSVDIAIQVFERMQGRDLTSWNFMILGLAMHGKGELALQYFDRMIRLGKFVPNSVTFVGVLSACNHRCMVDEGRRYFDMMVDEYKIEPQLEHYGCLVDGLARAGLTLEALDLVSSMPLKPDAVIWRSLLDSCCKGNASVEIGEKMAEQLFESGGGDRSGVYVLLSKVYASASRWDDVGLVRKLMTDNGVRKEPGCSLIEINGVIHELFAGDTSHPQTKEIYQILDVIEERLKSIGYTPTIVHESESKQQSLGQHSERLAIALGLLCLTPGTPIRIFKNLRVCNDCHTVTRLISKLFNVEIIVRDRARFHHFKDGLCSCMDFW